MNVIRTIIVIYSGKINNNSCSSLSYLLRVSYCSEAMNKDDKNRESSALTHREWRRIAKRERRRRVRQKAAKQRDSDDERLRATLESTAEYSNWIAEQLKAKHEREIAEKREHDEREKLWLEEEVRAQAEWRILQERRAKIRQEQSAQEELIRKDFETKQAALRSKRDETRRRQEEELKRYQDTQKEIDAYIDNGADTPECLRIVSETQSGKEQCPFFTKTGVCRYGDVCSRNHRRFALSKVILVPNFYSHFSLEKNCAEYDTDVSLEFDNNETRRHFRDFYASVVPELESFGRIKTLKFCRNSEIHLRGNLYVEYHTEREAARALRKLKGRYYAQRQLNCEFVNLTSWRNAVCGMTKCPKGRACNFLHTFRNPNDEYDIKSPPRWARKNDQLESSRSGRSEHRSKREDWDGGSTSEARNWRWSESPEPRTENRCEKSERSRASLELERRRDDSRKDRRRDDLEAPRASRRDRSCEKRESSTKRSRRREESSKLDENSSRNRERRTKKRREASTSDDDSRRRNSNGKRSKGTRGRSRSGEDQRRAGKTSKESRPETKRETSENNDRVDTNANDSRRSASGKIEKIYDERTTNGDSKIPPSVSDNEWNTTDSE